MPFILKIHYRHSTCFNNIPLYSQLLSLVMLSSYNNTYNQSITLLLQTIGHSINTFLLTIIIIIIIIIIKIMIIIIIIIIMIIMIIIIIIIIIIMIINHIQWLCIVNTLNNVPLNYLNSLKTVCKIKASNCSSQTKAMKDSPVNSLDNVTLQEAMSVCSTRKWQKSRYTVSNNMTSIGKQPSLKQGQ